MRVSRSTSRDRKCCGSRCCRATKRRSRSDGVTPSPVSRVSEMELGCPTGFAGSLAEVGGCTIEIFRQPGCIEGGGEYTGDLSLSIHEKYDRRMVHRVVTARQFNLVHGHAELRRHLDDRLVVAG